MCAQKLVLVPDSVYKGLVNTAASTALSQTGAIARSKPYNVDVIPPDEIGLVTSQGEIDALARKRISKRGKNSGEKFSAKRAMYEQEFRRYLKLRKDFKDRPVKVEISDASNVAFKPSSGVIPMPSVSINPATPISTHPTVGLVPSTTMSGGPIVALRPSAGGSPGGIIANVIGTDDAMEIAEPDDGSTFSDNGFNHSTNQQAFTPISARLHRQRNVRSHQRKQIFNDTKAEVEQYLLANKHFYNISDDGRHLIDPFNKRVLAKTSVKAIEDRLVEPTTENMPSPQGFTLIKKKALEDAYLRPLILTRFDSRRFQSHDLDNTPKTSLNYTFNKIDEEEEKDSRNFKPQLWRRIKSRPY